MIGQFRWRCHHVMGTGESCDWVNLENLDTRDPEPKKLVCHLCGTPAGAEALVRNNGA